VDQWTNFVQKYKGYSERNIANLKGALLTH